MQPSIDPRIVFHMKDGPTIEGSRNAGTKAAESTEMAIANVVCALCLRTSWPARIKNRSNSDEAVYGTTWDVPYKRARCSRYRYRQLPNQASDSQRCVREAKGRTREGG